MTAAAIGIAFSIGATGALLGALVSNRVCAPAGRGPHDHRRSRDVSGPALLPLALAPAGTSTPVLVALIALSAFVTGFAAVVYNVAQVSLRQAITPARMQGRMNATMRLIVWGTIPIGGDPRRRAGHAARRPGGRSYRRARASWSRSCRSLFSPVRGIRRRCRRPSTTSRRRRPADDVPDAP